MNPTDRPTAADTGLRDRLREGWFDIKNGELTRGLRVRSTDTVIDVSCGDGGIIGFCAGRGAEVIFLDTDEKRLAVTRARVRESAAHAYKAILSPCYPVPLPDASGDLVICTEVLEHVPDPAALLAELVRVTRPGGRILLTVADARSEQFIAAVAPENFFQEHGPTHFFTAGDLGRLVRDAGLRIESQQALDCFWNMYLALSLLVAAPGVGEALDEPHPITDHWIQLWQGVQAHAQGEKVCSALNELLPRTQAIVARKPG